MTYPHTLIRWDADAVAGWEREAPEPADDRHARVVLLSPPAEAAGATEVIPSWGANTPPWTWVEVQLRARAGGRWGRWFRVAAWDSAGSDSHRSSFGRQPGDDGELATDTLILRAPAEAVQARVLLCAEPGAEMPELESLALCLSRAGAPAREERPAAPSAVAMPLLISQYLSDPAQGHRWCSPTAMTMLLAYWHERTGGPGLAPYGRPGALLELAVPLIFDPAWDGTGNWAFNTALAAGLGLTAYVTRLGSLGQLARWTAAGVPVPISVRWGRGELEGAIESSAGHITVVRGFEGDRVLMAEPASRAGEAVARSYRADQLLACWQRAGGAAYIVHPPGWLRPEPGPDDPWA